MKTEESTLVDTVELVVKIFKVVSRKVIVFYERIASPYINHRRTRPRHGYKETKEEVVLTSQRTFSLPTP